MSLKTRFRNLGNVLAQDEKQTEVFVLESPVISNGMYERMKDHLEGTLLRDRLRLPGRQRQGGRRARWRRPSTASAPRPRRPCARATTISS